MIQKKKTCSGCLKNRKIFSKGLCIICWRKQYKPPERPLDKKGKPISDRGYDRIKKISRKGYEKNIIYKQARKEYFEEHPFCEVRLPGCLIPSIDADNSGLQIHHKKGRVGKLLYDKRYFLSVCGNCHRYIEDHPEEAKENGWSLSRLSLS